MIDLQQITEMSDRDACFEEYYNIIMRLTDQSEIKGRPEIIYAILNQIRCIGSEEGKKEIRTAIRKILDKN